MVLSLCWPALPCSAAYWFGSSLFYSLVFYRIYSILCLSTDKYTLYIILIHTWLRLWVILKYTIYVNVYLHVQYIIYCEDTMWKSWTATGIYHYIPTYIYIYINIYIYIIIHIHPILYERPPRPPTIRNSFTRTLVPDTITKLSGTIGVTQKTITFDIHVCQMFWIWRHSSGKLISARNEASKNILRQFHHKQVLFHIIWVPTFLSNFPISNQEKHILVRAAWLETWLSTFLSNFLINSQKVHILLRAAWDIGHNIPSNFPISTNNSNNNNNNNHKRQTANGKRQTANGKRQTANDKRQTTNDNNNNNNNSQLLVPFLKLLVCFKRTGLPQLSCCSHAGKALLMGFLANSSKEYMQQNQQAVLEASWVLKTDVFCIDMLVEARPAVSDLPPAWQQNAIQYWHIFALTYGLFYPYFPVVFVYFLRVLDEDLFQWFFHNSCPGAGPRRREGPSAPLPAPGNKYRRSKTNRSSLENPKFILPLRNRREMAWEVKASPQNSKKRRRPNLCWGPSVTGSVCHAAKHHDSNIITVHVNCLQSTVSSHSSWNKFCFSLSYRATGTCKSGAVLQWQINWTPHAVPVIPTLPSQVRLDSQARSNLLLENCVVSCVRQRQHEQPLEIPVVMNRVVGVASRP